MTEIPSAQQVVIDREQGFLLFATFCGDIVKTSAALGIPPAVLLRVVDEEGWVLKLAPILELKRSNSPGDLERAMNRALNFVQALRYKTLLERALRSMIGWSEEELREHLSTPILNKEGITIGTKFATRALADFASALEKAHALSYMALNDTASERVKRREEVGSGAAIDLHAKIAEAMSKAGASATPRAMLLDAQLEQAEHQRAVAAAPKIPVDDTFEGDAH